eukprot:TRINITY_DN399_c0_g1_i1.p1 TRINITY_DN399_c0_g1~~TRINITY_DN399_c0_g1_i1.p1  ORF type:complete len:363 (+),score=115.68 TRINITY_DN399_c0_g1_i1:60-1148(+)
MAAAAAAFRPPPHQKGVELEHYAVPSSNASVLVRAERRCALLDQWRRTHRYKLKDDERVALFATRRQQGYITAASYASVLGTWWITGHPNTSASYESFGVVGSLQENLLKLQARKFGLNIFARIASSFVVTIPFAYALANMQDAYFEETLLSPTPFGGFARYVRNQGCNMDNGQVVDRYVPWALYSDKEKKLKSRKTVEQEVMRDGAPKSGEIAKYVHTDLNKPAAPKADHEALVDGSSRALADGQRLSDAHGRQMQDDSHLSWRDGEEAAAAPAGAHLTAPAAPDGGCPFPMKPRGQEDFFEHVFGWNDPPRTRLLPPLPIHASAPSEEALAPPPPPPPQSTYPEEPQPDVEPRGRQAAGF